MNSKTPSPTHTGRGKEYSRKLFWLKYFILIFLFCNVSILTLSISKCNAQTDSANQLTNNSDSVFHYDSIPRNHFLRNVIPHVIDNSIKPKGKWQLISPEKILEKNSSPANDEVIVHKRKDEWKSWMFYLLIGTFLFLVLMKLWYEKEFEEVFQIFKPIGINQQLFRDNFGIIRLGAFLLSLNAVLIISIYLFLIGFTFHFFPPHYQYLFITVLLVSSILFFRFIALRVAGNMFPFKKEINFYQFNEIQLNKFLGIALLPFLFIISFTPKPINSFAIIISFVLITAIILLRYIRGFSIGSDYFTNHKIHFLVYICALEIAPLLLIIKLVKQWIDKL